ncbi:MULTISPECIES: type I-C CRISPR-associated protein Cas7/Csd2 [Mannheimia]|uniref:Type I-C CRISPR-associated protein Cas7/Csd2 n=1 Tax=Mannheimia pernigra TaxID=111844 RepID=A0A7H8UQJ7_9PAST|nr:MULTISPECIES: type I-C CRISPR-associated protein Cas7/Csd2 [Mannheimia]QLB40873.1 type I-C CRISPR-associated protein Cas7/Csd2 [Mannheimia pernigra]QLB42810.1 type I-C CRISPR-associated protein Cas7/Csd2 [Mannheimia pernigra]QLB44874.1 type I-C CRISPR-associated protein Cas7/Csd2 [Mannheimia pernigra]QTM01773.1 type I-C CRISPR-associated protein Cas7/Csd2 [Mannheimia sp. ZY171111]
MSLTKKIDFALIIQVKNANPNGDPLNGNRPRTDFEGFGEITDVCLKRKIRDRLQDDGESIFVQSDEKKTDGMTSLANRAKDKDVGLGNEAFNAKKSNRDETAKKSCEKWLDVRSFGQVFAFGKSDDGAGVSIAVRGPVTIQSAFSVEPVLITSTQITKSVSGEGDGSKKSSDTMGMKHRVDGGIYVAYGAMSPQLAERTGFSDNDADKIKSVLTKLFEGDASSARPEGSMQVLKLIWWEHNCKTGQYSSAKVHGSLNVSADGSYTLSQLEGLKPQEIDGF